jgi:hypothetical protein
MNITLSTRGLWPGEFFIGGRVEDALKVKGSQAPLLLSFSSSAEGFLISILFRKGVEIALDEPHEFGISTRSPRLVNDAGTPKENTPEAPDRA